MPTRLLNPKDKCPHEDLNPERFLFAMGGLGLEPRLKPPQGLVLSNYTTRPT